MLHIRNSSARSPGLDSALLLLIALIPLPFGGARSLAWNLSAAYVGALMIAGALNNRIGRHPSVGTTAWLATGLLTAVILWVVLQITVLPVEEWAHPISRSAAEVLPSQRMRIA